MKPVELLVVNLPDEIFLYVVALVGVQIVAQIIRRAGTDDFNHE